jgi:hypothetical protein
MSSRQARKAVLDVCKVEDLLQLLLECAAVEHGLVDLAQGNTVILHCH